MTWVVVTLLAVVSQTLRNAFSKKLSAKVGVEAVTLCRFLFALPIVFIGYSIGKAYLGDVQITSNGFYLCVFLFSVTQIVSNLLLISLFHQKNFAVAVTFSETATLFTAVLGIVLLSEQLSVLGWAGIIVAFVGFLLSTFAKERITFSKLKVSLWHRSTHIGLLTGLFAAITVIGIKKSFYYLETDSTIMRSVYVLLIGLAIEVLILTPIVFLRQKKDLVEVLKHPKVPFVIGALAGANSLFWFIAFSLAYAAYVMTVGQLDFILSVLISVYYFREKIYKNEVFGMGLMILGTILLLFA